MTPIDKYCDDCENQAVEQHMFDAFLCEDHFDEAYRWEEADKEIKFRKENDDMDQYVGVAWT
jgi:hypothetical protein